MYFTKKMSVVRPFSVLSKDEILALSQTGRFLSKAEILGVGVFSPLSIILGPATTQNLVVKFDGEICGGALVENASDDFPQQKKLENLLLNFAGSSPPISPKTSPTSLWKLLVLIIWKTSNRVTVVKNNSTRTGVPGG